MATFYKVTIKEIKQETANAVSVLFNIPQQLQSEFRFTAGQYITLQKEINGKEVRRAYSICSTPESGDIRVAIKAVEKGVFSMHATSDLKEGDEIEITAPEGRFLLNPEPNKNYIAFAAGSGITPILSMVKSVLENAKILSETLKSNGFKIFSGGTDTHLMLVDLRPFNVTGKDAETSLCKANITCNKNGIPFDDAKSQSTGWQKKVVKSCKNCNCFLFII
jgi:hypothetical protein